jgi:proteasome activator subunit 4
MRYPIQKSTRAKLVRMYYELCLIPGVEPRVLRGWADMLSRLLSNKPGIKRKLDPADLELPWQSMWRGLRKELWPKDSIVESSYVSRSVSPSESSCLRVLSRNMVNILLYVAEQCKTYYPPTEIPLMLETFLPLLTKEVRFHITFRLGRLFTQLPGTDNTYYNSCLDILPPFDTHPSLSSSSVQDLGSLQLRCY